jgi:hypothetical protein
MYHLYRANLDLLAEERCDLCCAFARVGNQGTLLGSWGHSERYGQDPAELPKFRALLNANMSREGRQKPNQLNFNRQMNRELAVNRRGFEDSP